MPWKIKGPCPGRHCPNLTAGGILCPTCLQARRMASDAQRPSASARGYTSARWRKLRAMKLAESPVCETCSLMGRTTAATEVDHIVPHNGPSDPLFIEWGNLSSKCKSCHSRKTATADGGFRGR